MNNKILLSDVLHSPSQAKSINLLDQNHMWIPVNQAILNQENSTLTISVNTNKEKDVYNRAYLPFRLDNRYSEPLLLTLNYYSKSLEGNAKFLAQIRDNSSGKRIWSSLLTNSDGQSTISTFFLPNNMSNRTLEFRLYVISEGPGVHSLTIKNMKIT